MSKKNKEAIAYSYKVLAMAIVSEAADEYKRNRYILDTIHLRKRKDKKALKDICEKARNEIEDIERFFKSEWFTTLSGLDGARAFEHLKETYLNEYVPAREEMAKKKGTI